MSKKEKSAYCFHFFANNFYMGDFFEIRAKYTSWIFERKFFLLLLALFLNFECKGDKTAQKTENLFYKRVSEFN